MENKGLLFIPDISGFTRFVNETEIEHSRLIIQELLEILINANELGLLISEIEGDAILFYKFGQPPTLEDLYRQVEKMFCAFHKSIIAYEHRRYCQCAACTSAIHLSLKVITHYGEFTNYSVKNFHKLIGKDIIVAHQLLKNDIEQHEYWLVTKSLAPEQMPSALAQWMNWNSSAKKTENGEIAFHYAQLSELKNDIHPDPFPQLELAQKTKIFSLSQEYDTDLITLFHATGDFNYRTRWQEDVKKVEEIHHYLPRVGMRNRATLESGETIIYASSYYYQPDRIMFSETDEKKNSAVYYLLEKCGDKAMLTLDFYLPKNALRTLLFKLRNGRSMKKKFARSLQNLQLLVKEMGRAYSLPATS